MVEGARLAQDIINQPVLKPYIAGSHVPSKTLRSQQDFEAFVHAEAHPGLHPCGTCRIGQDLMAVVDPELRVHGVDGLRIADASVMPAVVSGNLNAVAIMIGEKAADLLTGRERPQAQKSDGNSVGQPRPVQHLEPCDDQFPHYDS
jgi:choline dehydrogenase